MITAAGYAVLRTSPEPPTVLLVMAIRALTPRQRAELASGLGALEAALGVSGEPAGMLFDDAPFELSRPRHPFKTSPRKAKGPRQ